MECYIFFETSHFFSMGRRFVIVVLGNHLRDLLFSLFLFGSLVEYHPIIAKDLSRIHTIWKESFIWIVLRIRSVRGGEYGRVTY